MFTVLVIAEALCEVFSGPAITTLMATGKIKWYQIIVGSILLLNLPAAYLLLRIGCPIWVPFAVAIFMTAAGHIARLFFIRAQIHLSLRLYLRSVIMRCGIVTLVSVSVPLAIYLTISQGVIRFIVLVCASLPTTFIAIWTLGLDTNERNFLRQHIFNRLKLRRHQPSSTIDLSQCE